MNAHPPTPLSRVAAAVALAAFAAVAAPAGAVDWIHKNAGSFSYFVPSADWQATGNANGIDISSPTGDEDVSFAQSAWPGAVTTQGVVTLVLTQWARSGSLTNSSITGRGAVSQMSPGITTQRFTFQGVHHWVNGTQPVTGYMLVTAFNRVSARGFSTSLVYAPTAKASADAATLEFIRAHITYYGKAP
ncbi:MAG: hypothetical protein WCE44_04005 [Candidatus Velthaea sp.]|jgi:hypothetical protein